MADVVRVEKQWVWVKVRLPRHLFDELVTAAGSRGRGLGKFREEMPYTLRSLIQGCSVARCGGTSGKRSDPDVPPRRNACVSDTEVVG